MSNFDSPLEEKFFTAARERIPGLVSQMEVIACGRGYRLDFAKVVKARGVEALKVAIELDGYEYHSSKEQRNHDVQRDRDLMAEGWQIIRFTGSHVNRDVDKCVEEAAGLIEKWAKDRGVDPGLLPRKSGPLMPPKIEKRRLGIGVGIGKGLAALVLLVALCALLMASGMVLQDPPAKTADEAPSLESLTPDVPGPGMPGSEVIWTAQASDPNGDPIMYRFLLKGPATGGSWSDARGWTKENTWRWQVTSFDQGENQVRVEVSDEPGPSKGQDFTWASYTISGSNKPPEILSFKPDCFSPQDAGTKVVWRVRATDAENDSLQYRFLIKGPDTEGIWKDVTGWIEDDSWSWKTSEEDFGKNEVQVQVRDGKHASLGKEDLSRIEEFRIDSLNSPPDIKSLDPESKSPQPAGSTVVFKAQAIDPDGDVVSYKFWLKGPSTDGEWLEKTGWIKDGMWSWHTTGSDIGQSQVKVWIRDGKHEDEGDKDDSKVTGFSVLPGEAERSGAITEVEVGDKAEEINAADAKAEDAPIGITAPSASAPEKETEPELLPVPVPSSTPAIVQPLPEPEITDLEIKQSSVGAFEEAPKELEETPKEADTFYEETLYQPTSAGTGIRQEYLEPIKPSPEDAVPPEITDEAIPDGADGVLYLGGESGKRLLVRVAPSGT